jgi:uncharacterized membrane protein YoaK (UPF0700 family)
MSDAAIPRRSGGPAALAAARSSPWTSLDERDKSRATVIRDRLLMGLALSSGAIDAICVLALGKVFTAFMTGNVVYLGVSLAGGTGPALHSIAIALGGFAVGVFCSTLIVNPTRGTHVWPRRVTLALALSVIGHACFFSLWLVVSGHPSQPVTDVLLGISALAMGCQTAAVFSLGISGVFTTAATATLTVLAGDTAHWSTTRPDRRLLVRLLLSIVVGSACGGLLVLHARDVAPLLSLLTTTVVVVVAALAFTGRPSGRTTHQIAGVEITAGKES